MNKIVSFARAHTLAEATDYAMTLTGRVYLIVPRTAIGATLEVLDTYEDTFNIQKPDWKRSAKVETTKSTIQVLPRPDTLNDFQMMTAGLEMQHTVVCGDFTANLEGQDKKDCLLWLLSKMRA